MTKHTPGPWVLSGIDKIDIDAYLPGKSKEDIRAKQFYYVPLAKVKYKAWHNKRWLISKAEYRANARLIAAAPELLEALKKLVPITWNDGPLVKAYEAIGKQAEQAITKAEGKEV